MRCLIKSLLMVLLMVAIPFQGFAAATMRLCDAHVALSAQVHDAGTVDTSHCEHHHAVTAEKGSKQPPALDAHGKCGGYCCALGALATTAPTADARHVTQPEQSLFRSAFFYSLTLSPLQRPPLAFAA